MERQERRWSVAASERQSVRAATVREAEIQIARWRWGIIVPSFILPIRDILASVVKAPQFL